MKEIDFNFLLGTKANLYYLNELNRFQLGTVVFEALEDENDGYRTLLDKVQIVEENAPTIHRLAEVVIRDALNKEYQDITGWSLVDTNDGHVWLTFGTDHLDDYYPAFRFEYYPKPTKEEKERGELGDLLEKITK